MAPGRCVLQDNLQVSLTSDILNSNAIVHVILKSKSRAWCKTIVTTSFYIRSCNSFAPSTRNVIPNS